MKLDNKVYSSTPIEFDNVISKINNLKSNQELKIIKVFDRGSNNIKYTLDAVPKPAGFWKFVRLFYTPENVRTDKIADFIFNWTNSNKDRLDGSELEKIKVKFSDDDILCSSGVSLNKLLNLPSKYTYSLDLRGWGDEIDDKFLKKMIKHFPNLTEIYVNSRNVTDEGIAHLSRLENLRKADLSKCSFSSLPKLSEKMDELVLKDCNELTSFKNSSIPASLSKLDVSGCFYLYELHNLPKDLKILDTAQCVNLSKLELPTKLEKLVVNHCISLNSLSLGPVLKDLQAIGCYQFTDIGEFPPNLRTLNLTGCFGFTTLPKFPEDLEDLNIQGCESLLFLNQLPHSLKTLNLSRCFKITEADRLVMLNFLLERDVSHGVSLMEALDIADKGKVIALLDEF